MASQKKIAKVELIKQPHGGALRPPMKKGETMNPNGRPKGWVKKLVEELELDYDIQVNKATVKTLLQTLIYLPRAKLEELNNNVDLPVAIRMFTRSLRRDWDASSTDTLKGLIGYELANTPPEPPKDDRVDLNNDKLLSTAEYLITSCLDLTSLESLKTKLDDVIVRKRSEGAKIING